MIFLRSPSFPSPLHSRTLLLIRRRSKCQCFFAARRGAIVALPRASSVSATTAKAAASSSPPRREEAVKEETEEVGASREECRQPLPPPLQPGSLPRHVAVIMDGNWRWAAARGLPLSAGHEAGCRSLRHMVGLSRCWGIPALTVFAFFTEKWLRPEVEIDFLMRLFEGVLKDNLRNFMRKGIQLCIVGDSSKLPKSPQKLVKEAEELMRDNSGLQLIVANSYSGRRDIVQACQKIAQKVKDRLVEPADITKSLFAQELQTNCTIKYPYPDLLIRTGGELRLSNFLLWQSAYAELFFAKSH